MTTLKKVYNDVKSSLPVVVAIHGNSTSVELWSGLQNYLNGKVTLLAISIPGHSGNVLNKPMSFGDAALTILSQISKDKFHLLGASLGGHLAAKIAELAPNRVLSIITMGSPLASPDIILPPFIPKTDLIKSVWREDCYLRKICLLWKKPPNSRRAKVHLKRIWI